VKSLLAKFMPYKGIGLYVADDEVVACKVGCKPTGGTVELARISRKYDSDRLGAVIGEVLQELNGAHLNSSPVAVGLPAKRVFYSTRPQAAGKNAGTAQNVLREVMQSPNACIDELSVQVVKRTYAKRTLASVASCRRDYLLDVLGSLQECGIHPYRTEPAPLALLREAEQRRRVRKGKPAVRLLLGPCEALVIVTAGSVCVTWKMIKFTEQNVLPTLCASIRSCQALLSRFGIETPLDVAIVHGRADLKEGVTSEAFVQKVGLPMVWCEGPELSGGDIAYGLAIGCIGEQGDESVNLSKGMTPPPSIFQIFPWGEVAVQIAVVLCMALFLFGHSRHARNAVVPVAAELAKRPWANGRAQADLNKEKTDLTAKVEAIKKFVGSRIRWTEYTHDVSARLPDAATLSLFQGLGELEEGGGKGKAKRSFTLRGEAAVDRDGLMPKEIDDFLVSLRSDPLLKRDFPLVEVSDIKVTQPTRKDEFPMAVFTVLCLPKASAPPPAPPKPEKGKH
jgi:hypothetical protein